MPDWTEINQSSAISFRDVELKEILGELDPGSPNQAAKWVLEAWLKFAMPSILASLQLTEEEAIALFLDLDGWRMSPDSLQLMWANIEDPALAAKVKGWGMGEVLAVAIAIRRVGAGKYSLAPGELESELKRVGLLHE